jgi:3-oxoacyl-[acyl-carrier-protein] synthase II
MRSDIVITGVGMVTALGTDPDAVLEKVLRGDSAAARTPGFDGAAFGCPVVAGIAGFDPLRCVGEAKLVRLMNRDAQLAVAAARLALRDAQVVPGQSHVADEIAVFGATGLAGLPVGEVQRLVAGSVDPAGGFDPRRFGEAGLRSVSPILSFKILANMPVCFVGINEGLRGPNAVYTPWEGNGAQAIEAGLDAVGEGDARCALVGGCDVKNHALGFLALAQQGLFDSWRRHGRGTVPGEGAAFLVLESASAARGRGARVLARVCGWRLGTHRRGSQRADTYRAVLRGLMDPSVDPAGVGWAGEGSGRWQRLAAIVSSADGDPDRERDEADALAAVGIEGGKLPVPFGLHPGHEPGAGVPGLADWQSAIRQAGSLRYNMPVHEKLPVPFELHHAHEPRVLAADGNVRGPAHGRVIRPKVALGNTFAAAAALQVGIAARVVRQLDGPVLALCFGHGSEQAAFVLDRAT